MIDRTPDLAAASRAVFLARQQDEVNDKAWASWKRANPIAPVDLSRTKERDPNRPVGCNALLAYFGPEYHEYYTQPEEVAEISREDRAFAFSAEGEYLGLCKARTGEALSDEVLKERRAASAELLAQSHEIAARMEAGYREIHAEECAEADLVARSAGADAVSTVSNIKLQVCYRKTPFGVWRYFVHSGHVEKIPAFRRIHFIPYVAQSTRGAMLSALEFWLSRNLRARFWTFTSGIRVALPFVRERVEWLHRELSRLNAQPFMKDNGVRIVFRSTELGTPETNERGDVLSNAGEIERDEDGQLYFHVHAHCVVEVANYIPKAQWSALLSNVHAFWGHQWDEGGSIKDAREVCKYVTKPGEMLKLSPRELCELQAQLQGLHLVQPMGSLRDEIKARREHPEGARRLARKRTSEGSVLVEVKDWNKFCRRTKEEKAQDAAAKLDRKQASAGARVLSRMLPGFGPSGVSEPRVMVMAQHWNESEVRQLPVVARLIQATAHEFWAGSALRVHTCTTTVGETRAFAFADHLPPARNLPTGAEIAGLAR